MAWGPFESFAETNLHMRAMTLHEVRQGMIGKHTPYT